MGITAATCLPVNLRHTSQLLSQTPLLCDSAPVRPQDYALSPQANQRKGGLLCLAAAAVGLGDAGAAHLHSIVPPVLDSFTDQDSRVRYYACEVRAHSAQGSVWRSLSHLG